MGTVSAAWNRLVLGFAGTSKTNEPDHFDPQQPILDVKPLNSMPYIGPPTMHPSTTTDSDAQEKLKPTVIILPPDSTREQWNKALETNKSGIVLTGAAARGQVGPIIGLVDIAENEDSYLFRVNLPGVLRDENFECSVGIDGEVFIKGVTTTGEKTVCKNSQVFKMQTQNLCPPGHFSISFQLPGPVKCQEVTLSFETDGILEAIVQKKLP
ncbi:hypothetical protein CerSpe_232680 [Prunus speciosa]